MNLPVAQADLTGKHVIVTGGNSGLGAEAIKHFAKQQSPPSSIYLLCRNVANGQKVAKQAKAESGYQSDIVVEAVDLCSFASLKKFAEKYNAKGQSADVLLMNAGITAVSFELSDDGHEKQLQTNALSPFLLPVLLRPSLKLSSAPRVSIVSSLMSMYASPKAKAFTSESEDYIEVLDQRANFTGLERYNDTKLIVVMLARQFAKHFPQDNLTWTSVDPGFCMSSIDRSLPSWGASILIFFRWLLGRSSELGSRNLLWGSLAGKKDGVDGEGTYIASCKVLEPNPFLKTEQGQQTEERIYKQTVELFKQIAPEQTADL
jgi:retinol dehydrogenase 12